MKNNNFDKEMKKVLSPLSSKLEWIDSYKIIGEHKQQVLYYANEKIENTNYDEITKLLKDTYNTLDSEITSFNGIGTKYDKDGYKQYKEIKATISYEDIEYYVDYDTGTFEGARIKSSSSLTNPYYAETNHTFSTDNEFMNYLLNESTYEFKITNANFPQGDITLLNVSFEDDFYSSKISEQYTTLRNIYEDYKSFLNLQDEINNYHALWVYNQKCNNAIYNITMAPYRDTNDWIESYCGSWFDDVSEIPLYIFDNYPEQMNTYDNETLYSGYADANVDWNYSNTVSMAEYQKDNNSISAPNTFTKVTDDDELGTCWALAKDVVKANLKSPSSAKFPFSYGDSDVSITKSEDTYIVKAWVDAENSFGAKLRNNFTVTMTKSGYGKSAVFTAETCIID